jgi:hypothetical protein
MLYIRWLYISIYDIFVSPIGQISIYFFLFSWERSVRRPGERSASYRVSSSAPRSSGPFVLGRCCFPSCFSFFLGTVVRLSLSPFSLAFGSRLWLLGALFLRVWQHETTLLSRGSSLVVAFLRSGPFRARANANQPEPRESTHTKEDRSRKATEGNPPTGLDYFSLFDQIQASHAHPGYLLW